MTVVNFGVALVVTSIVARLGMTRTLVSGVAKAVDARKNTLTVMHREGETTFSVAKDAEIQIDGKQGELTALPPGEIEQFRLRNETYRHRFGFPFVICARLNKKDAILAAFDRRLLHSREEEIGAALGEIFKIAALRLRDIVI